MDANALNMDLDLAFNLQMEEALTASVAGPGAGTVHPSSSRNPISSPPLNGAVEENGFDYRGDHERSEEEIRRHKETLSSRIQNQKGQIFNVYVKGLVNEEQIWDKKVMMAGAGVVFCDSKDNLLMENHKALEGAKKMIKKQAELEALVHGLNAALILDLKRIKCHHNDTIVHDYVTGRKKPSPSAIARLVKEVADLQKKFEFCELSFVAHYELKNAVKIARDSIVSQIERQTENMKETCVICFEDVDVARMFIIDGCLHRYCFSCMKQHVEVKLLNGMLAECPNEACHSEVSIESCRKFLDPKLVDIMENRMKEKSIRVEDKVYCPVPTCSALMTKQEVLEYTKASYIIVEGCGGRVCVKCGNFFCMYCKAEWHNSLTCNDHKTKNGPPQEEKLLNSLVQEKLWRQCTKCYHMIELKEGCYHITCRCGYEFCYTCGAEWKNKKATCTCRIWDERNIIRR